MSQHHTTRLSPADEALELRDVGAADCTPTVDADTCPADADYSPEDEAAMERQYLARRASACPAGYVEAACLACNAALCIRVGTRVEDVLCPACEREGNALADDDDSDPTRPGGAALPLPQDVEAYQRLAVRYSDDELTAAVYLGDEKPHTLNLDGPRRQVWLDVMTAELLRRLDALPRKAA